MSAELLLTEAILSAWDAYFDELDWFHGDEFLTHCIAASEGQECCAQPTHHNARILAALAAVAAIQVSP